MSWFFFFIFTVASLNLVVVYSLLKKVGLDAGELLVGSLIALLSAGVCYNIATKDGLNNFQKGNAYVQEHKQ